MLTDGVTGKRSRGRPRTKWTAAVGRFIGDENRQLEKFGRGQEEMEKDLFCSHRPTGPDNIYKYSIITISCVLHH